MNTGFLDVLHNCPDHRSFAVGNAIHIHFDCVFQKTIDEDRPVRCHFNCTRHVTAKIFLIVDKLHGAASKHEGRPNEHRVPGFVCNRGRFVGSHSRAARGLTQAEFVEHGGE